MLEALTVIRTRKHPFTCCDAGEGVEAATGIEPVYAALQAAT